MRVEGLIINYDAGAAVNPLRIVKRGASDREAIQATDGSAAFLGVSDQLGADAAGDPLDVIRSDLGEVEYGGNVTGGDWLTSDSVGRAIATTTDGDNVIGRAETSGVLGDHGSVFIAPGTYSAGA